MPIAEIISRTSKEIVSLMISRTSKEIVSLMISRTSIGIVSLMISSSRTSKEIVSLFLFLFQILGRGTEATVSWIQNRMSHR